MGTRIKYVLTTSDILSVLILLYSGKSQYIQSVYGLFKEQVAVFVLLKWLIIIFLIPPGLYQELEG